MGEHGLHGIGNVGRRIGGEIESRRRALLQLGWNGWNDRVDLSVFIAREACNRIGDRGGWRYPVAMVDAAIRTLMRFASRAGL